jgi:hypothetical protein
LVDESLSLRVQLRDVWGQALCLHSLARVAQQEGRADEAAALDRESLALFHRIGDRWGIALALEGLAHLAMLGGRGEQAILLYASAAALRETMGTPLPPIDRAAYEAALAGLRATVGQDAYTRTWATGQGTPLEQVVMSAVAGVT